MSDDANDASNGPVGGTARAPGPAGLAPTWLAPALETVADDFARPVELRGDDASQWRATRLDGLEARTFECMARRSTNGTGSGDAALRFSGQLRTADGTSVTLDAPAGAELLLQRGELGLDGTPCPDGAYLRLPADAHRRLRLGPSTLVHLSIGQIEPTDLEERIVDPTDAELWLDGPVAGVSVLPLHGHRTGNVMLVRWDFPAAFRPKLDPTGEELLVLRGTLHDAGGDYLPNGWVRTPVPAWRSWGGTAGTIVCYKNGHFGELS